MRAEPALAASTHKLTGGLRLPNDETGDCQLFTTRLAAMADELGVKFRYNAPIDALAVGGRPHQRRAVRRRAGPGRQLSSSRWAPIRRRCSNDLVNIPVYPLKGYSITAPIVNAGAAPVSTMLDETYKIADHPLRRPHPRRRHGRDRRLRQVACNQARRETLELCVNDLFPGGGDTSPRPASGPACAR